MELESCRNGGGYPGDRKSDYLANILAKKVEVTIEQSEDDCYKG